MPTLRSATKQTKLEDLPANSPKPATKSPSPKKQKRQPGSTSTTTESQPANPTKRKAPSSVPGKESPTSKDSGPVAKKLKTQHASKPSTAKDFEIIINRAPVLQLWGASVAHLVHPSLPWKTCLGIGSSISTLCAISKGRSIGVIEPKDGEADGSEAKKATRDENGDDGVQEFAVMGFPMHLKNGLVVDRGKSKPVKEELLIKRFGRHNKYAAVKDSFEEALRGWKGQEDELEKKAFGMYEGFRPTVSSGQHGWGRKGRLDLEKVRQVVGG